MGCAFHVFYFQDENEAMLFKLRFSEHVSEELPYDPTKIPDFLHDCDEDVKAAEKKVKTANKNASKGKTEPFDYDDLCGMVDRVLHKGGWDGESELTFIDGDGVEYKDDLELERAKAIVQLKRATKRRDDQYDRHSTYPPKSNY
jgi:hypothetical protein